MIGLLETLIHIILYWIPFYYPLKAVFLVWAMHPQYEGATVIYTKFLKNHVKQNIEKVDRAMEKVTLENVAKVVADASANKIDESKAIQFSVYYGARVSLACLG